MNWQRELDELRRREQMAHALGGPDKIKRQHDGGRLTVRERIAKLIDPGSFHEVGAIAGRASYDAANELEQLTPSFTATCSQPVEPQESVVQGLASSQASCAQEQPSLFTAAPAAVS